LHHLAHAAQAQEVRPLMDHQHCKFSFNRYLPDRLIEANRRSAHVLTVLDRCVFV